jgi:hypothetical protein
VVNGQSNLILDSIVKPAKELLKNNEPILGKKNFFGKMDVSISVYYGIRLPIYYQLLNTEVVTTPVSFKKLTNQIEKKIWDTYLKNTIDLLPILSADVKKYIMAINQLYCKEAKENKLQFFDKKMEAVKKQIDAKIALDTAVKRLERKATLTINGNDQQNMASYADLYFIANCPFYSNQVFNILEFPDLLNEGIYLSSRNYIGLYFSKMMDFYTSKNWELLSKKFVKYSQYVNILETLKKDKKLYDAFPNRESLVKQPNGTWEYSFYLLTDSLEDNNKFYGKMVMYFNQLADKPNIQKIAFIKAKPNEPYRTSADFLIWKKEVANLEMPPLPPPLPPPTGEYAKELEKQKLEW